MCFLQFFTGRDDEACDLIAEDVLKLYVVLIMQYSFMQQIHTQMKVGGHKEFTDE